MNKDILCTGRKEDEGRNVPNGFDRKDGRKVGRKRTPNLAANDSLLCSRTKYRLRHFFSHWPGWMDGLEEGLEEGRQDDGGSRGDD